MYLIYLHFHSGVWQRRKERWLSSSRSRCSKTLTVRQTEIILYFRSPTSRGSVKPRLLCASAQATQTSLGRLTWSLQTSSCCALTAPGPRWRSTRTVTWPESPPTLWWCDPTPTSTPSTGSWTVHRYDCSGYLCCGWVGGQCCLILALSFFFFYECIAISNLICLI